MKRVLLPTDFSENAFNAISYAVQLFEGEACTFYLLHTYTPSIYQIKHIIGKPQQEEIGESLEYSSRTQLEQVKERLKNSHSNPKHTYVVRTAFNTLLNEVQEIVETEAIDCLVMGTKGITGAQEILLGTNTVNLIRHAKCPVIAIPPNFGYEAPKEMLFPTDYEIAYPKAQFSLLLDLVRSHSSRINVIHASTGNELNPVEHQHREELETLLGANALFHDLPNDNVIHAINAFQEKVKINLLVMVQNKHTFLERVFVRPVIRNIGLHLDIPMVVIPHA